MLDPGKPESKGQVGLERVVGVDLRVMEGRREQFVEDPGVGAVPVGGDLDG